MPADHVGAILQRPGIDRLLGRIDDPIVRNAAVAVLNELIVTIDFNAAWADDLDGQVGRAFHGFLTDEMRALCGIEKDVRAPDVKTI